MIKRFLLALFNATLAPLLALVLIFEEWGWAPLASLLLIRPCEVSSRVANVTILEVAHNALRVLLQHRHMVVRGLA